MSRVTKVAVATIRGKRVIEAEVAAPGLLLQPDLDSPTWTLTHEASGKVVTNSGGSREEMLGLARRLNELHDWRATEEECLRFLARYGMQAIRKEIGGGGDEASTAPAPCPVGGPPAGEAGAQAAPRCDQGKVERRDTPTAIRRGLGHGEHAR